MRVLVCEDSRADFRLLLRHLRAIDIPIEDVDHAETLVRSKAELARHAHDIAFVDYRLADGSGLDLLREATAIGWQGPIIMLTGIDDPTIDQNALLLGACDFLHKDDIKPEGLARSIRYATERKRLEAIAGETNLELFRHIRALAEAKAELDSMNKRVLSLAYYLAAADGGAVGQGDAAAAPADALGMWRFDDAGRTRFANAAFLKLIELDSPEELEARPLEAMLSGECASRLRQALPNADANAAVTIEVEVVGQATGQHRWVVMSLVMAPKDDKRELCTSYIATVVDVTTRRNVESANRYLARHDTLTGLPNRAAFNEVLAHDASVARRNGSLVALICIDLDRFKDVNDSYGHLMGDTLLKAVAHRLSKCARESDTVARLGGDEFAVVATNLHSEADAHRVVEKLENLFEHPFAIGEKQIYCGASIGCSVYPTTTEDLETLYDRSDAELYRSKRRRSEGAPT